MISFLILR